MDNSFISALLVSVFFQGGAVGLLAGSWLTGSGLLSAGTAILIGRLRTAGFWTKQSLGGLRFAALIVALAGGLLVIRLDRVGFSSALSSEEAIGTGSGKYRGVILWAEPKARVSLVAPHRIPGTGFAESVQPLTIPFDGVYWFFKLPDRQPPKNSYSLQGSPAVAAFHSSDSFPLEMEARQNFVSLLDLSCCSHISVEISNADSYPKTVWLELILSNLNLPGQPYQSLGRQPVTSIPQLVTETEFQPIKEVLSFVIPARPRIQQFDSATVKFIRNGRRSTRSAKIAIEYFRLVP